MKHGLLRPHGSPTFYLWCALLHALLSLSVMAAPMNQLLSVDFGLGESQQANIVAVLSSETVVLDVRRVESGLLVELLHTQVDDAQLAILDVTDFATPVSRIKISRTADGAMLQLAIDGAFEYDYRLDGARLVMTVAARHTSPQEARFAARGQPMSINFQDIPVRSVLQLIADYNQFNLVVADSVSGNLTLRLDGVPWQQILDTILQVKGLGKQVEGNVVLVAPLAELESRAQHQRQAQRAGELQSAIIPVRFANAVDVAKMLGGDGAFSMLSEQGAISVDQRTNALLIRESPLLLREIRQMVAALDVPVKQVQIEARIVSISEGNLDELGVRWGFNTTHGDTSVGASIESNWFQAGLADVEQLPVDDFLNVNLAASSPGASSIAFQVAKLGSDLLLDLELSALQRESKAEIISSPRLITTNKQAAYIEQGTEIPYLESTSSGATSVAFKKAVLSLKVTPQITPDNRLILDLNVTQDRPGEVVKTGTGEAVAINTQRIGTQVLVNNGETVVLGGIFQHNIINTTDKVPLLGDLPLLGALFRRSYEQLGKSELLIFVTPRVVPDRPNSDERKINLH
ncbi:MULTISPECIES: type IV pilus secretin PilQ [unclassified Vibrio]|uniref:type IV pilus secretin PilQ n=1 Tax=unclassified Vibrio TaxID=2614977 RepID=UPI0013619BBA|nr:type IV pilus secretin PilQ [Vibrio sp. V36_P2S2PM302]NAX26129.1 type IV pilus secretin PilQ [Vibrio sp. V38_P2S17PM301]NAX28824.1 type IV pilus secretin PilQ [Vibrio sp. V37_P2S8PM304]